MAEDGAFHFALQITRTLRGPARDGAECARQRGVGAGGDSRVPAAKRSAPVLGSRRDGAFRAALRHFTHPTSRTRGMGGTPTPRRTVLCTSPHPSCPRRAVFSLGNATLRTAGRDAGAPSSRSAGWNAPVVYCLQEPAGTTRSQSAAGQEQGEPNHVFSFVWM